MKRHILDAEIERLGKLIPTLKPRSGDLIRAIEKLREYRITRMKRDKRAGLYRRAA